MAYPKKRSTRGKKTTEPAVLSLFYDIPTSDVGVGRYIDLFADLSKINRKLMRQGHQLVIAGVTVSDDVDVGVTHSTDPALEVTISTAGNNWITHNAWTKGCALWHQMNKEVLDDNPSVNGKWADYKVRLTENMAPANTISALNGASGPWLPGAEWQYSTYVVPQHDVDAAGNVLPAEEWTPCLVGPDDVANKRFSLVKAYEDSRATVQDIAPNVAPALPNSFYLQLMDDGSQDPELAQVIIDVNDQPPYPNGPGEYPGGEAFGFSGAMTRVARGVKNDFTPTLHLNGFTAECGLMYITAKRKNNGTDPKVYPSARIQVHLVPGNYRGVMALPMGQ